IRKMIAQLQQTKKREETVNFCISIYDIAAEAKLAAFRSSKNLYLQENAFKDFTKIKEINGDLACLIEKFEQVSSRFSLKRSFLKITKGIGYGFFCYPMLGCTCPSI